MNPSGCELAVPEAAAGVCRARSLLGPGLGVIGFSGLIALGAVVRVPIPGTDVPMTLQLLDALPPDSKVTVYSCLSYKAPQVGADHLIFEDKAVDGFWLGPWIDNKNLIQILMMWRRAQKLLSTDLKSEIRAQYPFEEAKQAVQDYLSQMTGGKVLLRPKQ